ncbi:MAG: ATP-binding cassette domain-containing protein [Pirellulales bacterium]|nr:ATP-binding cassette domain-containing protein [Pirellulales bacterium]
MTPSAVPLLELVHLSRRRTDADGWLLEDISLKLHPGERLAIVGPSGAGKTLLLRAMVLLDRIDRGEVRWEGSRLSHNEVPKFRRHAIYLHQRPSLREATVEAAIRQPFPLKAYRGREFDRGRVAQLLAGLGRDGTFLEKKSRDLSGGEMQIAALVRAVQLDPTVLLLDEPTAALDAATAAAAEQLLNSWASEVPGRAIVWVSHDAAQSRRMATRTVSMFAGRLVGVDERSPSASAEFPHAG